RSKQIHSTRGIILLLHSIHVCSIHALLSGSAYTYNTGCCPSVDKFFCSCPDLGAPAQFLSSRGQVFLLLLRLWGHQRYFRSRGHLCVYPWLISRSFLEGITGVRNLDDEIRMSIFAEQEAGHVRFVDVCGYSRDKKLPVSDRRDKLKSILLALLDSIPEKKITFVKSRYNGTMPMLLQSLDDRVTFKMYTTASFLY
ncbi:MAG: hypothetical protein QM296_01605, partial [Bacillota bacterium]|nr:hypothetical protein [Bacillota bacterium]